MLPALIQYVTDNERVCPQPSRWNDLWKMLSGRRQLGDEWEPALPLILGAWWHTSTLEKRQRLISHLQYAAATDVLKKVDEYLRSLPETEWAHEHDFVN